MSGEATSRSFWLTGAWGIVLTAAAVASDSPTTRATAAKGEAVGDMGPEAAGSESLLRPLLKDGDPFVRKAAADALKQLEAN